MVKWFHRVGVTAGVAISLLVPGITAPLNSKLQFPLGGRVSALLGFCITYSILGEKQVSNRVKRTIAVAGCIVGLIAGEVYRMLLFDPGNVTPGTFVTWVEFGFFCIAYCGLFAFLAFAYRTGGLLILRKIGMISNSEN